MVCRAEFSKEVSFKVVDLIVSNRSDGKDAITERENGFFTVTPKIAGRDGGVLLRL